ncbi:aminopeptidase C [Atopobiaceae bacterium P1]|uniref:Aminopeptidase n=1 Tax=Leptogranulimonas caecicola TaxID=2894156 RepID=A0AAU9C442_9ACTN|nr:C1 family peptidase [Leptogranulimonas caecicola]BCV18638.1 aminopeptidase C [Atopobiaceae bacterium P1]BDC90968.1 aminopeptidase C [Leptogranulimonas caecicola]
MDTSVTGELCERAQERFSKERANIVAKNAVSSVGVRAAARVPEGVGANAMAFDIDLVQGDRCDQQRSGRCWMFASLNTMRQRIIERLDLKTFELSQAYPLFFDKLEKSNWFLNNIIDTASEPLDGRLVAFLLTDPIGDGGQWDMFRSLVKKYGVVPKEAMPETACSRNTSEMDSYLTRYLRGCALRLRRAVSEGATPNELNELRQTMMCDVWSLLETCLGEPPKEFDVRLRSKDNELVLSGTYTPQSFFAQVVQMDVDTLVSCINAETADKPLMHTFTVSRLGNVIEDGGVRYLNLPMKRLKELAVAQLKDGRPVWFGCDVAQSYLRDEGMMSCEALQVDELFGFAVEGCLNREERLDYGESVMTHAMVLEGVRLDAHGDPEIWKVENSWGKDHGRNGFDTITDDWFDQYVYQIVIDKAYLTDEERTVYDTCEPIVLAPWDPMGSLAK